PTCCSSVQDNQTCKRYCQRLQALSTPIQQMQQILTAAEHCPAHLLYVMWKYGLDDLAVTLPSVPSAAANVINQGKISRRSAQQKQRQRSQDNARSKTEVRRNCNVDAERSLFACLRKQEEGETCCQQSSSLSCGMVCRSLYLTSNPRSSRPPMDVIGQHCGGGTAVTQCIHSQAQPPRTSNPADNLPCCDKAKTKSCQDTCRAALQSTQTEDQIIDELMVACGGPDVREPLWQCFLKTQTSPSNHTPPAVSRLDNARLQCCSKAVTSRCRDLCTRTYKTGWSYHSEFYKSCNYLQPVSTIEATMHKCLMDVDEACQLGCNGLSFCTNFNNRPTELFRSCTTDADRAAAKAFSLWENGLIRLPQMTIPVKNVRTCAPDKWKAIACALQIKPCISQPSLLSLCKEDCMDILTQCVDRDRLGTEQSVPQLCNALPSVHTPGACVALTHFLRPSPYTDLEEEVTHPCNPNPCQADEVCELRRRKCKDPSHCKQFICKSACSLGQVSNMLVQTGTHVRIPDTARSSGDQDCFLGCRCDNSACPTQYKPVCGANGKTFPNSCLARCTGVTTFLSASSCSDFDPCKMSPCGAGERCVIRHQVCLGHHAQQNCPQYECISVGGLCNHHHHDPACDTSNEEFTNACVLLSHHHTLAYRGHCQSGCAKSGVVCGHDGETYNSECAAWAARSLVDYTGPCRATGNLTRGGQQVVHCAGVTCPQLRPSHCQGVVPPGSCCPVCAAQMRTLFDPRLVDVAALRIDQGPITVQRVVGALSRLLMVAQCDVFGFLSLEGDLVLLVSTLSRAPSDVQVEACNSEAERLASLISNGSPTLTLYLELSSLLLASTQRAQLHYSDHMHNVGSDASRVSVPGMLVLVSLLLALVFNVHRLYFQSQTTSQLPHS
ncbi:hypothetical protein BaRGS_00024796, partial [Batillaria attramentaria]